MKATITSRFNTAEKSYKNLATETERRINLIGNTDKGNQLITNYGGAFMPNVPINTAPPENTTQTTNSTGSEGFLSKVGNWLWGND
jgi:hypothetical protein